MSIDLSQCKRVLVFGGTFDPPQVAHVTLPPLVADAIGADGILYIPAAQSPLRPNHQAAPSEDRLAMLEIATANLPRAVIEDDEINRAATDNEPSYTIDTLRRLREKLGPDVELRLLIGGDQLKQFDKWRDYGQIEELAEPVVMVRPPDTRDTLLDALPEGFDRETWAKRLVDVPRINISATEVRQRLRSEESVYGMVPPMVERYINRKKLYREKV